MSTNILPTVIFITAVLLSATNLAIATPVPEQELELPLKNADNEIDNSVLWKGHQERDWHRTCFPCFGNGGFIKNHLLQLGCSNNGSTNIKHFTTVSEVDLDKCLTNHNAKINNTDGNDNSEAHNALAANGNFSKNCKCALEWQLTNGSLSCICSKYDNVGGADYYVYPFDDSLMNDRGVATCLMHNTKHPGRRMNTCWDYPWSKSIPSASLPTET